MSSFAGLLRLASVVICVIVIAAFGVFVFDQAKGASAHQQQAVAAGAPSNTTGEERSRSGANSSGQESAPHRVLDEVSNELTSPFSRITAGSDHVWAVHGVNLLLALLIYGFGFGYLARVLKAHL